MAGIAAPAVGAAIAIAAAVLALAPARLGRAARADGRARRRAARAARRLTRATTAGPGGGLIQRYAQRVGGLPVFGAEAGRRRRPASRADRWSPTRPSPGSTPADASSAISRAAAIAAARDARRRRARCAPPRSRELGIDPGAGELAWEVSLPAGDPLADFLVDGRRPQRRAAARPRPARHATGSASIFDPNPVVQQGSYRRPQGQEATRTTRCSPSCCCRSTLERLTNGKGCLKGHLRRRPGRPSAARRSARRAPTSPALTRSDNEFEAVMAYFHIDRTRAYVDSLGLSQPLRSKPQKVFANAIPDDNSFYSPMTHELVLGHRRGRRRRGRRRDRPRVRPLASGPGLRGLAAHARGRRRWARASATTWRRRCRRCTTGGSPFDTCIFDWDGISYSPERHLRALRRHQRSTVKKAEQRCQKRDPLRRRRSGRRRCSSSAPRSAPTPAAARSWTGWCSSRTSCSPRSRASGTAAAP